MKENVPLFNTTLKIKFIKIIQESYKQRGKVIDYNWLISQSDATIYAIYKRETGPNRNIPLNQLSLEDVQDDWELSEVIQEYFNKELDMSQCDYYSDNLYNEDKQVDYNGIYDANGNLLSDEQRMKKQEAMRLVYRDKR